MTQNDDLFTPESVDEQIEQFLSDQPASPPEMPYSGILPVSGQSPEEHLVKELQAFYQQDYERNRAYLAHARQRIMAHRFAPHAISQAQGPLPLTPVSQERTRHMLPSSRSTESSAGRKLSRGLSLFAAILVTGLLVGTLALALTLRHNQSGNLGASGGQTTTARTVTPTPTPIAIGTVLATHASPTGTNLGDATWSPDGTRLAAPAIDQTTYKTLLYIWDAASGQTLQTIHLNATSLGEVLWSPDGKYLALDNLQTIVIVDSQSGSVVKTITYTPHMALRAPNIHQSPWLSSTAPLGGGFGFYSVAWSPDSSTLAVAISDITTGKEVLLDPHTGAIRTTFSEQSRPIGLASAFSSDGKYLAVSYSNDSIIVVWNVATQQVVTTLKNQQAMQLAWQPGTHNLARTTPKSIELWDIDAHKLLRTYQGTAFAWAPDGKKLVVYTSLFLTFYPTIYKGNANQVSILDAASGAQIGQYISRNKYINSASWSPDGHAIATLETTKQINQIVIWEA